MSEELKNDEQIQENEELQDDQQNNENWKRNARTVIYSLAGVYLLSLAYNMFGVISSTKGSEQIVMIVFTILFTVIGLGMVIFGIAAGYRHLKKSYDETAERLNKK